MIQQAVPRASVFAFSSYLAGLLLPIVTFGVLLPVYAQLPSTVVGANVETANVSPSCSHYIKTNRGDLFDLAKLAGWNTLRLTQYETWGNQEMDVPYTGQNWGDVFGRAAATNIFLIVTLEMSLPERNAVNSAPSGQAGTVRLSYDEQSIKTILDALPSTQRSKVAIDLGNEENENNIQYSQLSIYTEERNYIRTNYPGVLTTVGGWKNSSLPCNVANVCNVASDGALYEPIEDFISAHIYVDTSTTHTPASDTASVVNYFSAVSKWSAGKPILMGEYGSSNGALAVSTDPSDCMTCTPDGQEATNAASVAGMAETQQQGMNAIGGLVWSYYARGTLGAPANNLHGSDNQFVLLVPDGTGGPNLPITVLPSASVVCPDPMNCPAFPEPLTEAIFTGGYTHVTADTINGKHLTMDGNFAWNPLSGNTVISSSDLTGNSGNLSGASLSSDLVFSDGTTAHLTAQLTSATATASTSRGATATGSALGYAHLTADTANGKHFTADGHLTWNMLSGNTVTTASDILPPRSIKSGGSLSATVTFEGGSNVHIVGQLESVTVTQP